MKFKVGDRVRYINNDYGEEYFKKAAKIIDISSSGNLARIKFDFDGNDVSAWIESEIEPLLVEVKTEEPTSEVKDEVVKNPEFETKVLADKIAKMEKQIKLLKILLESQGCDKEIIASALELLD